MLEIERSNLKMVIYGDEYAVKYPTVKMIRDFTEKSKQDGVDEFNVTIELLEKCGLPQDLLYGLEAPHLNLIVEAVTSQKKS